LEVKNIIQITYKKDYYKNHIVHHINTTKIIKNNKKHIEYHMNTTKIILNIPKTYHEYYINTQR
jgi:hypothetical protein